MKLEKLNISKHRHHVYLIYPTRNGHQARISCGRTLVYHSFSLVRETSNVSLVVFESRPVAFPHEHTITIKPSLA